MFDVGGFFGPKGLPTNQNCPRFEHMMERKSSGKSMVAKDGKFWKPARIAAVQGADPSFFPSTRGLRENGAEFCAPPLSRNSGT